MVQIEKTESYHRNLKANSNVAGCFVAYFQVRMYKIIQSALCCTEDQTVSGDFSCSSFKNDLDFSSFPSDAFVRGRSVLIVVGDAGSIVMISRKLLI